MYQWQTLPYIPSSVATYGTAPDFPGFADTPGPGQSNVPPITSGGGSSCHLDTGRLGSLGGSDVLKTRSQFFQCGAPAWKDFPYLVSGNATSTTRGCQGPGATGPTSQTGPGGPASGPSSGTPPHSGPFDTSNLAPDIAHGMRPCTYLRLSMDSSGDLAVDDLAAQEAAARDYQPEYTGPLVGEKTPSQAITEEYAKADPIFVQKTMTLPLTYSDYRPIRGDGNCGWRAIGFGYFETLISKGDKSLIEAELQRMTELNHFIETAGQYDILLFESFVDETFDLLRRLAASICDPELAMASLMEAFNDEVVSNAIIYHFRLLAASYLKANSEVYGGFVPRERGVHVYCSETIEVPNTEIENLSISLLVEVLLKPLEIALEVVMLDLTSGSHVNTHRFPGEASDDGGTCIYLLFRPEHYDILYRAPVNLTVNRATSFTHSYAITDNTASLESFSDMDLGALAMIPGFSSASPGLGGFGSTPSDRSNTIVHGFSNPSPHSPWSSSSFADCIGSSVKTESPTMHTFMSQQTVYEPGRPLFDVNYEATLPMPISGANDSELQHPVRFTKYCKMPKYTRESVLWDAEQPPCRTSMFRNSHFNIAHYSNPDFQPEMYDPATAEDGEILLHHQQKVMPHRARKRSKVAVILDE